MKAIHINWTKPFFIRNSGEYSVEDFEILTTILSALKWREKNGSIAMITDSIGAEFYRRNGLEVLWDDGIRVELDNININPYIFWAAGKLYALRKCKAPAAVIDTDFIVWEEILFDRIEDIAVIHDEELYKDVYPNINTFKTDRNYRFDADWNWHIKAYNTAFYVIKNQTLLDYYVKEAVSFMENASQAEDPLTYMVFAEQRLLAMCADKLHCSVTLFSTLEKLFRNGDGWFTHTWGMKQQMRDNEYLREEFCRRCINRIEKDYPYMHDVMRGVDVLKKYFI